MVVVPPTTTTTAAAAAETTVAGYSNTGASAAKQEPVPVSVSNNDNMRVLSTSSTSTVDHNSAMSLWWMSNLRGTPLQLSTVEASTTADDNNNNIHSSIRKFVFPPETRTVWVDVGVHQQTDFMPYLQRNDSLFVLGFEPSTAKWKPCEHHHCVVFWAAATPDYDVVHLNIQSADGLCNSLLKPNTATSARIFKGCVTQETDTTTGKPKTIQVPGIPLHALMERIPSEIQIEYVKIDAQGFDLEVAKGALLLQHRRTTATGSSSSTTTTTTPRDSRIQVMSLEAMDVASEDKLLYLGQPMASQVHKFLEEKGWIFVKSFKNARGAGGEVNMFFVSDQQYIDKVEWIGRLLS